MHHGPKTQKGDTQVIVLVIIALILAAGYVALDYYSEGEKNIAISESRGMQLIQGLSRHRLESGNYPDGLEKLTPKYLPVLPRCPGGQPFAYQLSGGEFTLTCPNVVFKTKPYVYDSRSRAWKA